MFGRRTPIARAVHGAGVDEPHTNETPDPKRQKAFDAGMETLALQEKLLQNLDGMLSGLKRPE